MTDEMDELRAALADVEAALEEEGREDVDELRTEQVRLEGLIAERQNPAGLAVAGDVVDADAEEYKPAGSELVVSRAEPESVFLVLDRHDEAAILEEFQRRALKVMLYDFPLADGKQTVDLSYQGVNEAIRLINNTGKARIRIKPEVREIRREVVDGREFVVATVYAEDENTGYGQFGVSKEPVWMKVKPATATKKRNAGEPVRVHEDGDTKTFYIFDVFAETKALNKAQRNALKTMIPEGMRQTLIAQYVGNEAAIRQIKAGAGAEAEAELPPPLDDERARELVQQIRAVYTEIRQLSPTALLPGQFNARLRRAQHSHDLMETELAALEAQRDHLKAEAEKGGAS